MLSLALDVQKMDQSLVWKGFFSGIWDIDQHTVLVFWKTQGVLRGDGILQLPRKQDFPKFKHKIRFVLFCFLRLHVC